MLAEQKHYTRFPPSVKQHLIFSNPHLGKSTRETCGRAEITRDVGDKTHELRNLCGVERAEKVGCVFYFQEEGRDTPPKLCTSPSSGIATLPIEYYSGEFMGHIGIEKHKKHQHYLLY